MSTITDLTGTIWILNDIINDSSSNFNITFTSNSRTFYILNFESWDDDVVYFQNGTNSLKYLWSLSYYVQSAGSWDTPAVYDGDDDTWKISTNKYKTIEITGGTDVTNTTLISWLETNATQVPPFPIYTFDLSTLNLPAGNYTITVKTKVTGYKDSIDSNSETYSIIPSSWPISTTVTYGSYSGATSIAVNGTAQVTISVNTGYALPLSDSDITVTNATLDSYNSSTGVITISNPTGNVSISTTCPVEYSITTTITNGTSSGDSTIIAGSTATVNISANSGYIRPTTVDVNGATSSYNSSTGVISLSNPTGNVTISATCSATYYISTTVDYGYYSGASSMIAGETAYVTITPYTGYIRPTVITVTGATYSYNSNTGVISLSNPQNNITITATCIERLDTPTLSISGDILTIEDTSGHADSFDIFVDSMSAPATTIYTATTYTIIITGGDNTEYLSCGFAPEKGTSTDITDETTNTLIGSGGFSFSSGVGDDIVITNATGDFVNGNYSTNEYGSYPAPEFVITQNSSCTVNIL